MKSLDERFFSKVHMTDGCWEWTGALVSAGYGQINVGGGRREYAHRVAYTAVVGPIPAGLVIDHLCENSRCVRPEHLEAVTVGENNRRGNGLPARYARRTECTQGHPYSGDNVAWRTTPFGHRYRVCRACVNARAAEKRGSDGVVPNRRERAPEQGAEASA